MSAGWTSRGCRRSRRAGRRRGTRSAPSPSAGAHAFATRALELVEDRLAEAPLDHRMDGRALFLDEGLHADVQLVHAALDGHGEQRQHLLDPRRLQRVEIAGPRGREGERADRRALVVQRRDHEAPDARCRSISSSTARPARIGGEVLDEQRLALERGALDRRSPRSRTGVRWTESAKMHALSQAAPELSSSTRSPSMAARPRRRSGRRRSVRSLRLQRLEARARDDRLLVDQVALEARQHLLVRHVQRPEHREAAESDAARREYRGERLEVPRLGLEAGAHVRSERGQRPSPAPRR